jgi:hypothetical protein
MQEEKKYGCVYFFRHVGLEPVKIGYSSNNNPIKRFEQFKTYAPFGAEILGFIQTEEARHLESKLHLKYAQHRLDGEWFKLSSKEVKSIIDYYTSKEQIKDKNNFQIEYAKYLENNRKIKEIDLLLLEDKILNQKNINIKNQVKKYILKDPEFNRTHLAKKLGVSRRTVHNYINELNKK